MRIWQSIPLAIVVALAGILAMATLIFAINMAEEQVRYDVTHTAPNGVAIKYIGVNELALGTNSCSFVTLSGKSINITGGSITTVRRN